jgi:hypothetical protein
MFSDVVVLSFLIAYLRGGRFRTIPQYNQFWVLALGIAVQLAAIPLARYSYILIPVSYAIVCYSFWLNREHEDIRMFLVGWLLNTIVIVANGGRMPVLAAAIAHVPGAYAQLMSGYDPKHVLMSSSTHLSFLGDIFFVYTPIPRAISVGDAFIGTGAFLFIQRIANKPIRFLKAQERRS